MSSIFLSILLALLFLSPTPQRSDGQLDPDWCIADEQTPDEDLQMAMKWACEVGGADCSKIQENQDCYLPNTMQDHASYVFNYYYQRFKKQGGTCYFNSAALVTALDPSHNSCKFEYLP
ncbi:PLASMODESMATA CALLOSE-BINDING PROTEIN 5-like [Pyrus communis]|uniref:PLASMODESMATA CALLOSE-BINDING PROTEIN 5-like n=1 Tax=Pyrus communis TaxID=23211 RepID=UPI0035C1BD7F